MYVGMAVPKTTETRCRDGSVQARQFTHRLHKSPHPLIYTQQCSVAMLCDTGNSIMKQKRCRDGVIFV